MKRLERMDRKEEKQLVQEDMDGGIRMEKDLRRTALASCVRSAGAGGTYIRR